MISPILPENDGRALEIARSPRSPIRVMAGPGTGKCCLTSIGCAVAGVHNDQDKTRIALLAQAFGYGSNTSRPHTLQTFLEPTMRSPLFDSSVASSARTATLQQSESKWVGTRLG